MNLLRNSSKSNYFHIENTSARSKIAIIKNCKFVINANYINGDLIIRKFNS